MSWKNNPATPKQKEVLQGFGIHFAANITIAEASELIDAAVKLRQQAYEQAKTTPLESIIEQYTHQRPEKHKIFAPWRSEKTPSVHVYDDGTWWDYGAGFGGDVIDFMGRYFYGDAYRPEIHFTEVVDKIGALDIKPLPLQPKKPAPQKPRLQFPLEMCLEWHDGMTDEQRAYWHSRGLEDKTIDRFFLGFDGQRYTIPLLYRLQCFGVKRRITPEYQSLKEAEITAATELLRAEHPDWDDAQIYKAAPTMPPKYVTRKGSRAGLFNGDTLLSTDKVVICEGEIDAMLLEQMGYPAVCSTGGAGKWEAAWASLFAHVRQIYILYDNDAAGASGALKARMTLFRAKKIALPKGIKDVGKLWEAGYAASWLSDFIK